MKSIIHTTIRYKWLLLSVLLFVLINSVLISYQFYFLLFLPFAFLVAYLAIFSVDKLVYFILFFVPLSFPLEKIYPDLGFNVQLPSEIMIMVAMIVFLLKVLMENDLDKQILRHPVSLAIYLYLAWMFLTVIMSTMPLVSFKFFVSRVLYIFVFYFLVTQLFRTKKGIEIYFWVYFIPFFGVMLLAIYKMFARGYLDPHVAQFSANPFFTDHTSYGAIIAMVLPFILCFLVYKKYSISFRVFISILAFVVLLALVFSYTRAAWISVGAAFFVWGVLKFRMKLVYIVLIFSFAIGAVYVNRTQIVLSMEQNHQDSSKELNKHFKSIYNIRSDISNLERINRWNCAIKMYNEKPVFGWGPGTYMFQYAPFQVWHDKTNISTNRGNMGNAHSEFLGPLAESGLLGMLTFTVLLIIVFYTAVTRYILLINFKATRLLLLGATLGLVTYCTHGFLNNFLDTDKASVLFWGYIAMVVAIDVYHSRKHEVILQN